MRNEFSRRTKLGAFTRANGRCGGCGSLLGVGKFEYDHAIPAAFDGPASLDNCVVLCLGCHRTKTGKRDIPAIAKSNRIRARRAGIKKKSKFACSKDSPWKKRLDGTVVRRNV